MAANVCLVGVVIPGPVLGVETVVGIVDEEVDEDVAIISLEQDLDWFVLLARQVVEVVTLGEIVDFERCPDGVLQKDD